METSKSNSEQSVSGCKVEAQNVQTHTYADTQQLCAQVQTHARSLRKFVDPLRQRVTSEIKGEMSGVLCAVCVPCGLRSVRVSE